MEFRTLKSNEIDVRVASIDKTWATLLLYKDARVDMNILDEEVGAMNWKKSYVRDNANCIVSIWDDEKKEWVSKEDTGTESFSEAEKGLASDSFKRACFNWGIGRELYTAPTIFITPRKDMGAITKPEEESKEFFIGKNGNYTTKTRFYVDYIDYKDKIITDLIIRDNKGNIRFEQLTPETAKEKNKEFLLLKSLIEKLEEKDNKFNREDFYKYFKVSSNNQLNSEQTKQAIKLLKEKLK